MNTYQNTTENLPKLKYGDTLTDSLGKMIGTVKYDYKTGKPLSPETPITPNTPLSKISTLGMEPQQTNSYQDLLDRQARGEDIVNTSQIRSDVMSRFQDRINSINSIYNQQLEKARQEGVGRIGSGTAILAGRGLAGSMRGESIKGGILDTNRQVEGAIDAERNAKIAEVYGMADQMAVEEAARRREAMVSGAKNYIDFIKTQGETKKSNLTNIATQMFIQGIDPNTASPEELAGLAKKIGVSTNDILSAYGQVKYENKAKDKAGFELSEGQARYEFDPETGTYKQVASLGKTYKPSTGGGGTGGTRSIDSFNPQTLALARQIQSGSATLQSVPSAQRGEVALAMQSLGLAPGKEAEIESNIQIIDSLLNNPKLSRIFGSIDQLNAGKVSGIFSSGEARLAKNQYDQLKGILSLENRQKLKGSGAISDFEFKVLSDSATALGRNLNTEDAKKILGDIKKTFQSAADRANEFKTIQGQGNTQSNKLVSPDGTQMVYVNQLTPEELQEAKDAGWKPQ